VHPLQAAHFPRELNLAVYPLQIKRMRRDPVRSREIRNRFQEDTRHGELRIDRLGLRT